MNPKNIFILAGEASGDLLGADLMAGLSELGDFEFSGVGGETMIEQGLHSIYPIHDLSVMGFKDVLPALPRLLRRLSQTVKAIIKQSPDIVVLIDAQVFNQFVASKLRKKGFTKPIILYVAPSVWAWGAGRAKKIKPLYDEVMAVLPFEPAVMERLGGPQTVYVGHPAVKRFTALSYDKNSKTVLLLPGSRSTELKKHMPLYKETAILLVQNNLASDFVIHTPKSKFDTVREMVADWPVPVTVMTDELERQESLRKVRLAIAVSGTVTLELALSYIPHILTFVAESTQVKLFMKSDIKFIGLPNIIMGREIIPEVLFDRIAKPEQLFATVKKLLGSVEESNRQVEDFSQLRAYMEKGAPEAPLHKAADEVARFLN